MENLNSILNRREIYCYIIEEIIGLKLPDYQFMKYINILRIPLLWLSIQQIFQLLYVPYICISIKKKERYKIHITCRSRKTQIVIHNNYAYYTYVQTWNYIIALVTMWTYWIKIKTVKYFWNFWNTCNCKLF